MAFLRAGFLIATTRLPNDVPTASTVVYSSNKSRHNHDLTHHHHYHQSQPLSPIGTTIIITITITVTAARATAPPALPCCNRLLLAPECSL